MHFVKVHGLGNDFVVVNAMTETLPADLPELARRVCHRYFGIGADGLVLLHKSDAADLRMQIINSDGSEPEMCGNAIRCVAKYAYEQNLVKKTKIQVETLAGIKIPELILENGAVKFIRVDMGEPILERAEIPMRGSAGRVLAEDLNVGNETFKVTAVSMGNPHCLIFVDEAVSFPVSLIGPQIEIHEVFPRKTNVEFIEVLNRREVKMKVWERGAGETMACGTGACATVVAAVLNGLTERQVTVHLTGGDLLIEWADNNHVYMTGPAEEVFAGSYKL
ncbi:diaminopimelate epimerase [Desulfofarcimen acetoxidans DSM 771]|uniref:Diaminopimelate epimerase n=1 Tax=Desulfofarcimen acetoxidans (strain ATCC 49208 / DSM 771 / KCTC 5769 / VKM B-1644 / 5575) TaxID=485916 RepID=C8W080_DESAS|nr:diaminopimelate epimerase [Desulfofarcimen acetoxidans]ACV63135.1 diaminopimelate epimerase [Desulfofarcimen acetoxidans DSM 771]